MGIFAWDDKYLVGIREIDEQHRRLVRMINDLHEAMVADRGQQALREVVGRMVDYTGYHFSTEEALLKRHGYPQFDAHRHEHDLFTAKAHELQERLEKSGFVLSLEVIRFLRDWLSNHILVNDRKYAAFLSGAGVR
jgi:hemerythrin